MAFSGVLIASIVQGKGFGRRVGVASPSGDPFGEDDDSDGDDDPG